MGYVSWKNKLESAAIPGAMLPRANHWENRQTQSHVVWWDKMRGTGRGAHQMGFF